MSRNHREVVRLGTIFTLCTIMIILLSGCLKINVSCADGNAAGATGCGIPKPVIPGVTKAQGSVCNSGSVCRIENLTPCDITNPSAKCTSVNNNGACSCNCQ